MARPLPAPLRDGSQPVILSGQMDLEMLEREAEADSYGQGDRVLSAEQIERLQTLKVELEAEPVDGVGCEDEELAQEALIEMEIVPRTSFPGPDKPETPKVQAPRSGRAAGPWKGPRVVMQWGKVTRSFREPAAPRPSDPTNYRDFR